MSFEFNIVPSHDRDVIQHHSRSFSLASKLLPREIRGDVEKLYAWCRWCDDAVDDASSQQEAEARLRLLREDVKRIYNNETPLHPASDWLACVANKYSIPEHLPLDLLSGMETDLNKPVLQTVDDLLLYCYQAAGTVGLMMAWIMGATNTRALQQAKSLGMAMQLTNITRDISEDWHSGRRYVPSQWLPLVPQKDMTPSNTQVRLAVEQLLLLADKLYEDGYQGLRSLPDGARLSIRVAGNIYQEIGNEIRRQDLCVMQSRVFVPLKQKILLVAKSVVSEIKFRAWRTIDDFWKRASTLVDPIQTSFSEEQPTMSNETRYLGFLGISLTFVMATTLFFLMGLNPKATTYSSLPWIYSATCATIAVVTGLVARRINRQLCLSRQ